MSNHLEQRIARFAQWRADMVAGIESYKSWLDRNGTADIQQSLRIYDLIESLKHDRMTLALIAELSRGKTELINAMLFGNFKRRILPSDVGRTTMCPTELFHDPQEEPYVKLLPIETRRRNETVASLKRNPVDWIKIRLHIASETALAEALQVLVQTKTVTRSEAQTLGLCDSTANEMAPSGRDPDKLEIPAWRHALVNYPHPLLTGGLTILDTPGLNALGTEPELTMSAIPNAHVVLFMLAMDSGVTRSDLEVWRRHVQPRVERRLAVLNKIDLLWDDIKSDDDVRESMQQQLESTARLLELPPGSVLPLSAKKALVARVRGDRALLEKSGIEEIERLLAEQIVPAKQEILRAAVVREIGSMVDASRLAIVTRFKALREEYKGLSELKGKNANVAQAMLARVESGRIAYQASFERYRAALGELEQQGSALLNTLSDDALDTLMNTDREFIEDAWTTAGLIKSMQGLFEHFTAQADRILRFSKAILALVDDTYAHFHAKAGFDHLLPPPLNLEQYTLAMHQLQQATIEYCHHPKQILTEKHWLVPNFYEILVHEAQQIFLETREDTQSWLKMALNPLNIALREHESMLAMRIANLGRVQNNLHTVAIRGREIERELLALKKQHDALARMKAQMGVVPVEAPAAESPAANDPSAEPKAKAA